ncbi:molecular chaperone SurA [Halieaceae bacterium IMCC14734]|uniref:Chaperone SurA n=1 Tax=Candidatus Litorirhabdus singularis TaxID=2518993 RepID=A0ABT3TMV2_9GAMM|nr:peptidylprolyl isomerase [Candidatus Litorirhabdus singularis]MCX2983359.1 molecular chaperone SurA [Candidatus Litorirhabdus singularis]
MIRKTWRQAALAIAFCCTAMASSADFQPLDSVVAIVEDDVIMSSELRERLNRVRANLEAQQQELPDQNLLVRETLDRLVLESIQLQMAARAGVRIGDAQLNDAVARVAAQNRMSVEQFRVQLEAQGQSYTSMRNSIERELILQRVQSGNVNQRIQITEQEALNYLESEEGEVLTAEQYHLIHALLPIPEGSSLNEAAAKAHVEKLYQRIKAGEEFGPVIASSGEPYLFTGGDLGWRKSDEVPSLFAEVAPTLQIGQSSPPIRSASGFHLVIMAEKRGGTTIVGQNKVRHILVKPSTIRNDEQTREFVARLRRQIIDGADFAELARANSEDIGSAQEGGELGWTNPGQMVPEFEQMVQNVEIGAVSEPFRTQFGWHILQVEDRRQEDMTEIVAMNRAREVLHQRKYQEELDAWLRKIRDEAFVDIK